MTENVIVLLTVYFSVGLYFSLLLSIALSKNKYDRIAFVGIGLVWPTAVLLSLIIIMYKGIKNANDIA